MALDDTARQRLADVRDLEPTSNGELAERWGMDSGKEVAAYLQSELSEYVYRGDDRRIRTVDVDEGSSSGSQAQPDDDPDDGPANSGKGDASHGNSDGSAEQADVSPSADGGVASDNTQAGGGDGSSAGSRTEPDDGVEPGSTDSQTRSGDVGPEGSADADTTNAETVEHTTDELDDMLDAASEAGRADGVEVGYEAGKTDAQREDGPACSECGGQLLEPGTEFDHDGRRMQVDPGEFVCDSCGLVFDESEVGPAS